MEYSVVQKLLLNIIETILEQAEDLGCEDIELYHVEPTCWILRHAKLQKNVAFGYVPNTDDKELKREIGAFEIKTKQLNWALAEGFTHRQMIDQLDVFEMVPIYKVAERLSFSKPS